MRILSFFLIAACIVIAGCGGSNNLGMNSTGNFGDTDNPFASTRQPIATNSVISSFWEIEKLKTAPRVEVTKDSTEHTSTGDVKVQELYYDSPALEGKMLKIFAYYAFPLFKTGVRLPAIIIVHGGTGLASKEQCIEWASKGYAALSMDLPGKGHGRDNSRSEGPSMDDDVIFSVKPSPKSSYLYPAVNSVCRAVSVLSNCKEVDSTRIGVMGSSWGGTITLIANGIDSRISAACTIYGAGFITEDSCWLKNGNLKALGKSGVKVWKQYYDPSSYLASQHGKTLFVGATQDLYYPLKSLLRTYNGAGCIKALCLIPNKSHALDDAASGTITKWFDWAIRSGPELPSIKLAKAAGKLTVTAKGARPVTAVDLVTADGTDFSKATWKSTELKAKDGTWAIEPPAQDVPYYITARDDNGALLASEVHLPLKK